MVQLLFAWTVDSVLQQQKLRNCASFQFQQVKPTTLKKMNEIGGIVTE